MATTKQDIREWLAQAKQAGATHMLVVCDSFDYEDFPVYVSKEQDVKKVYETNDNALMQKVMEVYNLSMDIELQLKEHRAFNF